MGQNIKVNFSEKKEGGSKSQVFFFFISEGDLCESDLGIIEYKF